MANRISTPLVIKNLEQVYELFLAATAAPLLLEKYGETTRTIPTKEAEEFLEKFRAYYTFAAQHYLSKLPKRGTTGRVQ